MQQGNILPMSYAAVPSSAVKIVTDDVSSCTCHLLQPFPKLWCSGPLYTVDGLYTVDELYTMQWWELPGYFTSLMVWLERAVSRLCV